MNLISDKNTASLQTELKQNKLKLDTVEQQLKMRNVIAIGFPENEDDANIKQELVTFSNDVLQIKNMKENDIECAFRCGKRRDSLQPRNLVIHFRTKKMRDTFYEQRKKTPISDNNDENIYINEDLTLHRVKLFHDARKLKKQGRIHATWTQFGNIMVKRTPDHQPKAVFDQCDLRMMTTTPTNDALDQQPDPVSSDTDCSEDEF